MKEEICKLLGISNTSYYRWKEERSIIPFLERYFSEKDLNEYLDTGMIMRLERQFLLDKKMKKFIFTSALLKLKIASSRVFYIGNAKSISCKYFLSILELDHVENIRVFKEELEKSKPYKEKWKSIMFDFIENELSELEMEELIDHKDRVLNYCKNNDLIQEE